MVIHVTVSKTVNMTVSKDTSKDISKDVSKTVSKTFSQSVRKEAAKKAKNAKKAVMESTPVTVLFEATHTDSAGHFFKNGISVRSYPLNGTIEISMADTIGRTAVWMTDPTCSAHLATAGTHYVAVVADAGPNMYVKNPSYYTLYTCIYTIHTPNTPLNTPFTHPICAFNVKQPIKALVHGGWTSVRRWAGHQDVAKCKRERRMNE